MENVYNNSIFTGETSNIKLDKGGIYEDYEKINLQGSRLSDYEFWIVRIM